MRKIMMFDRVSADGYFAAPNGTLDWVVPDSEIDKAAMQGPPRFDTILFGRRTYQMFEAFWPYALDDPKTAKDPHADRRSPEIRAMAVMINESNKIVFSRTLDTVTWKHSQLIREFDRREIEKMKSQPGKDMIIFGSGTIVSQLTENQLIDEYQFIVCPLLLGSGRQLIHDVSKRVKLDLVEARPFPSGNVRLQYARAK